MNNIGYVLSGYDIYNGNPRYTEEVSDPGFRSQIFTAEYTGETTADGRYCSPDGLSILSCDGNCVFDFNTDIIYGTNSYYHKLKIGVGLGIGGAFSASAGYHKVEQYTESGLHMYTQTEIACCVYTTEMGSD